MADRVVVGMSGGVDSAVAAALLVQAGYEVVGVSMRLWDGGSAGGPARGCCSLDDFVDARRVAGRVGIPFYVMDFREEFERGVVEPFVAEYARGRTPNPCVACNQSVKFGALRGRAQELGASAVATGHYARVARAANGRWELRRGVDTEKDQSYFLFSLPSAALPHTLFPVGDLTKAQVRALAAEIGLPVAGKPDSQEVCFAPGRSHGAFVSRRLGPDGPRPGAIVDGDGAVVGEHAGVHTVTIGQRRGLGARGPAPRYVTAVDPERAVVQVGSHDALLAGGLVAEGVNWLVPEPPAAGAMLTVKIRSRHSGALVRIDEAVGDRFTVRAEVGLRAVTPGQAAVLYDGDRVVGGGWIARPLDAARVDRQ